MAEDIQVPLKSDDKGPCQSSFPTIYASLILQPVAGNFSILNLKG